MASSRTAAMLIDVTRRGVLEARTFLNNNIASVLSRLKETKKGDEENQDDGGGKTKVEESAATSLLEDACAEIETILAAHEVQTNAALRIEPGDEQLKKEYRDQSLSSAAEVNAKTTEDVGVNTIEEWPDLMATVPHGSGNRNPSSIVNENNRGQDGNQYPVKPSRVDSTSQLSLVKVQSGTSASGSPQSPLVGSPGGAGRQGIKTIGISTMDKERRKEFEAEQDGGKIAYKFGNIIGHGAMGTVHTALIEATGESVAAKKILFRDEGQGDGKALDEKLRSLKVEMNLLKALDHPNIVRYLFADKVNGPPPGIAIFMEKISGGCIGQFVKDFGALPEQTAGIFAAQLLFGLAYLHEMGVAHRDIKPANCLVSTGGDVKLGDFGTATLFPRILRPGKDEEESAKEKCKTLANVPAADGVNFVGTPYYMAPEIIRQEENPCHWQCDIWSVGCSVMEMLTGATPFDHIAQNPTKVLRYVGNRTPGEDVDVPKTTSSNPEVAAKGPGGVSDLSEEAQDFLRHCLASDPEMRPSAELLLHHPWFTMLDVVEGDPQLECTDVQLQPATSANRKREGEGAEEELVSACGPPMLKVTPAGTPVTVNVQVIAVEPPMPITVTPPQTVLITPGERPDSPISVSGSSCSSARSAPFHQSSPIGPTSITPTSPGRGTTGKIGNNSPLVVGDEAGPLSSHRASLGGANSHRASLQGEISLFNVSSMMSGHFAPGVLLAAAGFHGGSEDGGTGGGHKRMSLSAEPALLTTVSSAAFGASTAGMGGSQLGATQVRKLRLKRDAREISTSLARSMRAEVRSNNQNVNLE